MISAYLAVSNRGRIGCMYLDHNDARDSLKYSGGRVYTMPWTRYISELHWHDQGIERFISRADFAEIVECVA
jgi:hypothetical protein